MPLLKHALFGTAAIALTTVSVYSLTTNAEQATFAGKFKTQLPKITITTSNEPVSDVKPFTLSVSPNGGVCQIEANAIRAMGHTSEPYCLLTWNEPEELEAYLRGLKGVVKGHGEHSFTYTVSIFDKDSYKEVMSDTYTVSFAEPKAPSGITVSSNWQIKPESSDQSHSIYNRNEVHKTLLLAAEPRNYVQQVSFGGLGCKIQEGEKSCTINVNEKFIDNEISGSKDVPYIVADQYNHFTPEPSTFQYVWDFRPAIIVGTHVNTKDDMLPLVVTEYGEPLVLMHNQAAIVVESPHANIDETWWLPTDPKLEVKPDLQINITNTVNLNDTSVSFNLGTLLGQQSYITGPISDPVKLGGYLVYVYDFSEVNDGLYDFKFSTMDSNGNGEVQEISDIYVDRNPPDIQFVINGRQHRSNAPTQAFSISDITAMTWGGWEDGSEIVSATLNDEPLAFSGGTERVKRFENREIALGSLNSLTVTAQDKVGNQISRTLDFYYGNYKFKHYATPSSAKIEQVSIMLEQQVGASCIAASSVELAQLYSQLAQGLKRGCTIEWLSLPDGILPENLASLSSSRLLLASGKINDVGVYPYHFKVHQHDAYGLSQNIYEGQGEIEITELEAPTLLVGSSHIALNYPEDYKYRLPEGRQLTIPVSSNHIKSAEVVLELRNDSGEVVDTFTSITTRSSTRHSFRIDNNFDPLTAFHFNVRAYYSGEPSVYTEKPYHFFTVPSSMVRLKLEHPEVAVQGSDLPIIAKVGVISSGEINYSPSIGQWDVGLYTIDPDSMQYVSVQETVLTDDNGQVALSINADLLNQYNNKIFALAKLKTPYPEVNMTLKASSLLGVPVLTTGNISVELRTEDTELPVPARFYVRLNFETSLDEQSIDKILWQSSDDSKMWTDMDVNYNAKIAMVTIDTPSSRYIRAAINHKLSSDFAYTNVIKLTGYEEAVLDLQGDQRVLEGGVGEYSFSMNEYALLNSSSEVEWSFDNRVTWSTMSPTDSAQIFEPIEVVARLLITPEGQDAYYIYDTLNVTTIDIGLVKPIVTASDVRAEIGDQVTFSARFGLNLLTDISNYRYHYELPNGNIVESLTLEHTLTADDFIAGKSRFKFRAWVDGLEMQTVNTRELTINQLIYTFPDTDVTVLKPERVTHSNINVLVDKPLATALPKTVILSQEVILPPELEVIREQGRILVLNAKEPGLFSFTVRIFDNRGNSREHQRYIEALEPAPMFIKLSTRLGDTHVRPPLRVISSVSLKPGSERDRISTIKWFLNDELQSEGVSGFYRTILEEPGDFTVKVFAETELGQTAEETYSVTVEPNKPPYCEPFWEDRSYNLTLHPNCVDDDGNVIMVEIIYAVSEEENQISRRYSNQAISFVKDRFPTNIPVTIVAIDNSADSVEQSVPWPN